MSMSYNAINLMKTILLFLPNIEKEKGMFLGLMLLLQVVTNIKESGSIFFNCRRIVT